MLLRSLLLSAVVLVMSGCATQAPTLSFAPAEVLPSKMKVEAELKTITVTIAKDEERLGETQVGFFGNQYEASFRQSFKDALEESLVKSAIFSDSAQKKVSLTAKVMKFQSPGAGINFDTHAIVRYELFDRSNGRLIFRRDIESVGSVPFDYAFIGAIRLTEARNRAMRSNIENFLGSLAELKLPATAAQQ